MRDSLSEVATTPRPMSSRRPLVVVTNWVHAEVLEKLQTSCDIIANQEREPWPSDVLRAHLSQADAAIMFMTDRVDADLLAACPKLRLITCALKGYDNFDVEACTRHGVVVTIVEDLLTVPTAELTVGLAIALSRNLLAGDSLIRAGQFQGWRPQLYGTGLAGSTVGYLGMGAIGRAIAERLVPFGCKQIYHDRHRLETTSQSLLQLTERTKEEVLAESDFLILALPLTKSTIHIIDAAALAAMKPGAFLINPARGSLVDEAAVAEALASGHLGGYAADVFAFEDWARSDRPLGIHSGLMQAVNKTVLTPHLGSAVDDIRLAIALEAAESVLAFFRGEPPHGALNFP